MPQRFIDIWSFSRKALRANRSPFGLPLTAFVSLVRSLSFACHQMQSNVILKQTDKVNQLQDIFASFFLLLLLHKA